MSFKKLKKYTIFSLKSRNEEEKIIPSFNSINMYNTLSSPSKLKNKNQKKEEKKEKKN